MFFKNGGIVWNPERSPRNLSIRDLFCSEEANPNSPRILYGERSENLSLGRFLWRKPEKKNQYASIQLRLTIHPTYPRVKGISVENRTNLDQDFRATKRSALLHTGIGEKWGLSGVFGAVCPGCPSRSAEGFNGACTKGLGTVPGPGSERCNPVAASNGRAATRMQRDCYAVATARKCCNRVADGGGRRDANV